MAHEVFISYSTKDKAVADAVCARLEQDNCRCWYAPRDIMPGADWAGSIIEAIEQSKVMVLIFTDFANESRQVLREINNAVRCGVVIVPFRLTKTTPSGSMRYYLSTVHWLDALDGELEENTRLLSELVRSVLAGRPAAVPAANRAAAMTDPQAPGQPAAAAENAAVSAPPAGDSAAKPEAARLVPYGVLIHLLLKLVGFPLFWNALITGRTWLQQVMLAVFLLGYAVDIIPALPLKGRGVMKPRLALCLVGSVGYLLFAIRASINSETSDLTNVLLCFFLLCGVVSLYVCSRQEESWAAKKWRWVYSVNRIINLILLIIVAPLPPLLYFWG